MSCSSNEITNYYSFIDNKYTKKIGTSNISQEKTKAGTRKWILKHKMTLKIRVHQRSNRSSSSFEQPLSALWRQQKEKGHPQILLPNKALKTKKGTYASVPCNHRKERKREFSQSDVAYLLVSCYLVFSIPCTKF